MDVNEAREFFRKIMDDKTPLRVLLGMRFEGTFGARRRAGIIQTVDQESNTLLVNQSSSAPYLRIVNVPSSGGVSFYMSDIANECKDFALFGGDGTDEQI